MSCVPVHELDINATLCKLGMNFEHKTTISIVSLKTLMSPHMTLAIGVRSIMAFSGLSNR